MWCARVALVTTYGPNDMVLDNWGTVDRWVSEEKIGFLWLPADSIGFGKLRDYQLLPSS